MVGASGFEPPASWSRTRRASQAALRPDNKSGAVDKRPDWKLENSIALRPSLELAVAASSRARKSFGLMVQDESF